MRKLLLAVAMLLAIVTCYGQRVALVSYMKVPAAGTEAYEAIEKEWKKLHQAAVNEGKMTSWGLFYVHNSGTESPYNYVTVQIYEKFEASLNPVTVDDVKKLWGDQYTEMFDKTMKSRDLISSTTMAWQMGIDSPTPSKYLTLTFMKADNVGKYLEMEKKGYMPMHKALIDKGNMHGWSVWTPILFDDASYDAVAVNGYANATQMGATDYDAAFDGAKSAKTSNELVEMVTLIDATDQLRKVVKTQLWERLESTDPKK